MSETVFWLASSGQAPCWLREGEAFVPLTDRALQYGDGLFETVRLAAGQPWQFASHWERLSRSALVLGIGRLPWDADEVAAALRETAQRNGVTSGFARLTLSRGGGPRGYLPPVEPLPWLAVQAVAWQPDPRLSAGGHRLALSPFPVNEHSPLTALKTLNGLEKVLARQHAARAGATEALLVNTQGELVEASSANLFWVERGHLCTPALATGALPGIMRTHVLQQAAGLGLSVDEVRAQRERLTDAAEAFLTNVLWGIVPVAEVGGRRLVVPGPVTRRLQAL